MRTFTDPDRIPHAAGGRAVAVGTFDGVHLGHRKVIGRALEWGRAHDTPVAVVTFDPHPLQLLSPEEPPRLLTSTAVKSELIGEIGVDELVVIPFTQEFSRLEPERFCADVLVGQLGARFVSVGTNFRFGHGASGDAEMLRARSEFEADVVPLVEHGGAPVSSSRIRELVEQGEVAAAGELLGAPFQLEGLVVEGDARGRTLGMPTANLALEAGVILPGTGVYAGRARDRAAAINVGVRPTFETSGETLVEAYLLDFEGDLYDERLRLVFLDRIRDELRFESADELVRQMQRDVERVREIVA
jgi:riboflavin kinase/FMN adenylyltransferase